MPRPFAFALACLCPFAAHAAAVSLDVSGVRPGPMQVKHAPESVSVEGADGAGRPWRAEFSLDPAKPLITAISIEGQAVIERARPFYQCSTGIRRGGWDAFFDFPPSHPDGTRSFIGEFKLTGARAASLGDRVELAFDGMHMGIFDGMLRYVFFPGSVLIEQQAVLRTQQNDVAYFYDAGLRMTVDADRRAGGNMESRVSFYDSHGEFQTVASDGPERHPASVRYRTIAARTGPGGSVAVFPAPHRYFFARDFTTNMGFVWHSSWRGLVSLGTRQLPDDHSPYYPWMNAPPGTEQKMGMFLLLDAAEPRAVIDNVLRYTNRDVFPTLAGFQTFAPHWHLAYTVQAMEKGIDWTPPFKPVLQAMGINAAMIMDFHGDGHPADVTELRLQELDAFYRACRAQSGADFLLIPSEEANVYLGGHWALVFPKPVYWFMSRQPSEPFVSSHAKYGTVYRIGNAAELLDMVRRENGYMYQTHPRTKGSTGYPDKIRETEHFRDPRYLGAGWKAMPSDLSSPRLGERSLKLLDDMNNWGMRKRILGEVDVFQIDSTHELYAHMNANYVRIPALPAFAADGKLLDAVANGDFFVSTGEVLLPSVSLAPSDGNKIVAHADVRYTFPLEMAEIVWGDGAETHRQIFPLRQTRQFGNQNFTWQAEAKDWKWARLAVWDVAGDGAFINPVWR